MLHATSGIVLRTIKFSETSVVSKIYTEKFGIQSYIVNGVRSEKSRVKAGLLQALSLLDMQVYHREHRNLNRIKEMRAAHIFVSLPFDVTKSSVGLFMIEVLNKCIREEEANRKLFRFAYEKIKELDELKALPPWFLLEFLVHLSGLLGFQMHGSFSENLSRFNLSEGTFISEDVVGSNVLNKEESGLLSVFLSGNYRSFSISERKLLM